MSKDCNVRPRAVLLALLMCLVLARVAPVAAATVLGSPSEPSLSPLNDPEHDCLEPVPEAAGASGISDDGEVVKLDVALLLDGVSKRRANDVMERVAESYAPLDIDVVIHSYRKVRIEGDPPRPGGKRPSAEMNDLFAAMKSAMEGTRPKGSDLVHLLTSKDVYYVDGGEPSYGLAGVADCIGGVRYPEHAFSFSEGTGEYDEVRDDMAGVIAAHEIGHLMGAHHHYGNCAEGSPLMQENETPCTVMFPAMIFWNAGNFGTLEGTVVRGHAVRFASP